MDSKRFVHLIASLALLVSTPCRAQESLVSCQGINSASDIPTSDTTRERNVATLEMMGIALPRVGRLPNA